MSQLYRTALACLMLAVAAPSMAQTRAPLVMGAASLAESLNAAADAWAAKGHPHPVIALGASSALARQIEAGAPADIFISADEQWMDEIAAKGLIRPATRHDLLAGRLVLIAPVAAHTHLRIAKGFPLAAALRGGRLATGAVTSVPAGIYAKQALTSLGVWDSVSGHIAGAENVRAALALVDRGEAPFGIVYATDARADPKVAVVDTFPESSHPPIRYPIALLIASTAPDAAGFARFLASREGQAIFRARGFGTP